MKDNRKGHFIVAIYFLLAIYLMPFMINADWGKDLTLWATSASLVENNSFDISWTADLIDENFSNVERKNQEIYSKAPPANAILGASFYAISRIIIGEPDAGNIRTSWYVMRFMLATFPLLILATWLVSYEVDTYSLAILLFCTPIFGYSLMLGGYLLTAVLVYFSFRLMFDTRRVVPTQCFLAGLMMGLAFLTEYSAFVALVIFGFSLIKTEPLERNRRVIFYFAGVFPAITVFFFFNWFVLGSMFFPIYQLQLADSFSFAGTFISPARGLIFFSPIFFFSLSSVLDTTDSSFKRQKVKLITVLLTSFLIALTSFGESAGLGAFRLIVITPLLLDAFFDGAIEDYPSILRGLLFTISFLFCTIPLLTFTFAPANLLFPHNSFWMPLMYEHEFFSLVLVNTFGFPKTFWTILPAIILLLIAIYLVWRDAKNPFKFFAGILLGLICVSAYIFIPKLDRFKAPEAIQTITQPSTPASE